MDRTERFHKIENRLRQKKASVSFAQLQSELEVSVATLKRDLRYLRDRFDEPIVWDPQTRGYRARPLGSQRFPGLRAPASLKLSPGMERGDRCPRASCFVDVRS